LIVVVHRVDDLEIDVIDAYRRALVAHRVDDLEKMSFYSFLQQRVCHRVDDLENFIQCLRRHILSLKTGIKQIKTFSF